MKASDYFFPEIASGGYTRVDGTIEFYGRINALLRPGMVVLDYGAGRGRGSLDDTVHYRRVLRTLKGKCARLIGVDVDDAVRQNPYLDEIYVLKPGKRMGLQKKSVDLIVSDAVFEHISDTEFVASELNRVLKPGGWICARTPNRWGYIGIATNIIPNMWHVSWLKHLQPNRKEIDVFPTTYKLNTKRSLRQHFPQSCYDHYTYGHFAEPAYFGESKIFWGLMLLLFRMTPESMSPIWMIFIQKKMESECD